ncbi:alpha/beta hydrolase, partial [Noviherbaspirillum sp.]|uniref:alpha/beta hydrolase n=1 Tax=Noviherbaspirillum sp. TaxID=1926288 RepID=UPI002FE2A80D
RTPSPQLTQLPQFASPQCGLPINTKQSRTGDQQSYNHFKAWLHNPLLQQVASYFIPFNTRRHVGMKLAILITAIVFSALLGLYLIQDRLMLFPMPDDPRRADLAVAGSVPWSDGGIYRGLVFEPASQAKGTILFFHGNAGAAQYRAAYAHRLTTYGYRVVLHEYPGFGARSGHASLPSAIESSSHDAESARARWPGPMYLMGESLGAGIAAQVATSNPAGFEGLVLITPWENLAALVNENFAGIPLSLLLRARLDTIDALKHYPGNIVVIGAENDTLIPVAHARTLAGSHTGVHYLELLGAGHNDWFDAMSVVQWDQVISMMAGSQPLRPRQSSNDF